MHFCLQAPNLAQTFLGSPWTDFEGVPRNQAFSREGRSGFVKVPQSLAAGLCDILCRFYYWQNPLPDILSTSTPLIKSSLKMSHEKIFVRCMTCIFKLF